jgi:hypothetical protein
MISVSTWRFTRDHRSPAAFLNANRPSTNALSVLYRWQTLAKNRSFEVSLDEDDKLEATLGCSTDDMPAGSQLDAMCLELGIVRMQVPTSKAAE